MNDEERFWVDFSEQEKRIARDMNEKGREIDAMFPTIRRTSMHYVLDENNVCVAVGLGTWCVWFEHDRKKVDGGRWRVARDEWDDASYGRVVVSTVFLGIDHAFMEDSPRKLFETMVWWGWSKETQCSEQQMWRYSTYDQAARGQAHAVKLTRQFLAGAITREQYDNDEEGT